RVGGGPRGRVGGDRHPPHARGDRRPPAARDLRPSACVTSSAPSTASGSQRRVSADSIIPRQPTWSLRGASCPIGRASTAASALSRTTVPARGRQEAILTVPAFGRYAVTVASPQGTALQLVDRIAGPGQAQGTTGKTDGRLDVFLDRGEYQIVAFAPEKGSGDAQLKVRGFTERNAPEPRLLVELKPVE